jgi:hypothetical protein
VKTTSRKPWTMREIKEAQFYANEGLSITRTARVLGRGRGALGAAASRYNIKFNGDFGAPYGNHNRTGTAKRTREDILQQQRLRMRKLRERRRIAQSTFLRGWILPT